MDSGASSSGAAGSSGVFANAPDMDQEGLVAFAAMAEEAMKIERMVVQQKELLQKLDRQYQKLQAKEQKEMEKYSTLCKEVQSTVAKNKLLQQNFDGKRENRCMMEQMTADLERQLQLERNSLQNKIQNMEKTEDRYAEIVEKYESVYLSSPAAQELKRVKDMKSIVVAENKRLESALKTAKQEYKQRVIAKDQDRKNLVLKAASLATESNKLKAKLENDQTLLRKLKEQLAKEQEEIEMLQKQVPTEVEGTADKERAEKATGDVPEKKKRKVKETKSMLNFATFTLPDLQLPQLSKEFDDSTPPVDIEVVYSDFLQSIHEINELCEQEENQAEASLILVDLPPTLQLIMQEESIEPSQAVNQEVETTEEVAPPEPTIAQPANDDVVAPATDQQGGENEVEMTEQEDPQETQQGQEQMQERETASQVGSDESGAQAPGEAFYSSAMSQSSEGSSLDLLDDETRRAYMMKLMGPPEFSVGRIERMLNNTEAQPTSERSEYVSPFLTTANSARAMIGDQQQQQPTAPPQGSNVENTTLAATNNPVPFMSSLFGEASGQEQTASSEQQAFSFGGFSFGASSNTGAANLFGSSSLFGSPTSQSASNNLFGTSQPTEQSSEAFNLNFDSSGTPSVFKLF